MIEQIKKLCLKKNDILLIRIDKGNHELKRDEIQKAQRLLGSFLSKLEFRVFGIIVSRDFDLRIMSRAEKTELKKMLEESLKGGNNAD